MDLCRTVQIYFYSGEAHFGSFQLIISAAFAGNSMPSLYSGIWKYKESADKFLTDSITPLISLHLYFGRNMCFYIHCKHRQKRMIRNFLNQFCPVTFKHTFVPEIPPVFQFLQAQLPAQFYIYRGKNGQNNDCHRDSGTDQCNDNHLLLIDF